MRAVYGGSKSAITQSISAMRELHFNVNVAVSRGTNAVQDWRYQRISEHMQQNTHISLTGWTQSTRKKFTEFSRLFRRHKLTSPQVIATKSKCNNKHHQGSSTPTPLPSILVDIYWAGSLLTEIVMILFTQSTGVLHKYFNDELKLLCLLQFSPRLHRSTNIPRCPGL